MGLAVSNALVSVYVGGLQLHDPLALATACPLASNQLLASLVAKALASACDTHELRVNEGDVTLT